MINIADVVARNSEQLCATACANPRTHRGRLSPGQLALLKARIAEELAYKAEEEEKAQQEAAPIQMGMF